MTSTAIPPLRFTQVDVFTELPLKGNPVAVVHDADALSDAQMQAFANWTNLSETTFLLQPTDPAADYRLRIFTPKFEFQFAGHPTLGSCHAWLEAGGQPRHIDKVVQQCGVGLVNIVRQGKGLAFEAPPSQRDVVGAATVEVAAAALGIHSSGVARSQWLNNGSSWWLALMLADAMQVLALQPDMGALAALAIGGAHDGRLLDKVAVFAPHATPQADADFEVRAFGPAAGFNEDPVTGSLNASLAQWLMDEGVAANRYRVAQGTTLGRAGRVTLERRGGAVWVGGTSVSCVRGELSL
jgi:PhzF family phenazine biosynthesis protein